MTSNKLVSPDAFKLEHYQRNDRVELFRGGRVFFDVLDELINQAEFEIHFQFYILESDETGLRVIQSLKEAAKRGVNVQVILDSYGSDKLEEEIIESFIESGVSFKWFKPVITLGNMEFGRRMHHKIVVIDNRIALTTGVNVANRYNDFENSPAWLDFAILLEGTSAQEVQKRCLQMWEKSFEVAFNRKSFRLKKFKDAIVSNNPLVKISANDWLRGKADVFNGYKRGFRSAQQEIRLAGGYFLPGRTMRKLMKDACQRGVQISVILTGTSDVRFAKSASEYLYDWMLQNGIRIYEWIPTVMHGKVAVVDSHWSTVGSFNLNYLSTFESIELNFEVIDEHFGNEMNKLLSDIAHNECKEITYEDFSRTNSKYRRIKNWFSYVIVRYTFRILNAFSKKPDIT